MSLALKLGGVESLARSATNWILVVSLGAGCVLLSGLLHAQNSDTQPAQAPAQSRASAIRQMIQEEAARRNAARQGVVVPPGSTLPGTQQPEPPSSTAAQPARVPQPTPAAQVPTSPASTQSPLPSTPASVPTAPAPTPAQVPAAVKSVKISHDKTGSVIEIVNSRAIVPALQTLSNPPRLVIDLPNANVAVKDRYIEGKGGQFSDLHVEQFQVAPPVARVTVALAEAKPYTWDGAGNRLTIRVKPPDDPMAKAAPPVQPATVPTFSTPSNPAVVPVSAHTAGSAVIAGAKIGSGSSVTASTETAVLHIARGGELHVCPGSTVSVTASKNGQELMFGMSTGTLETHYHLATGSDAVLTPDFRFLLAGPGDFNYAISSNTHGDTCVRALLGNTASMLVSELMGDRTYQVKPTEQVVFHEGRIDRISNDVPFDCGCAAPPPPVMRAALEPPQVPTRVADANLPPNLQMPSSNASTRAAIDPMLPPLPSASRPAIANSGGSQTSRNTAMPDSATAPLPISKKEDIHVQIEAPLVFRGSDRPKTATQTASNMPPKNPAARPKSDPAAPIPMPAPPPQPKAQEPKVAREHRGFFGKVKGFFSAIFH